MVTSKPATKATSKPARKPDEEAVGNIRPAPPKPPRKVETLFAAYLPDSFGDLVVFGRKIDAAEYALDQEPAWKVVELRKGVKLAVAIDAKNGQWT
ncbi:hypothetical protein ASD11_01415 [Aeromicrobium sp. Root495]|uniref:hypothetical protein n=1 Tax=Aeromicrobium sp. Root495 TaxID=1736550 RepID=UPI0007001CFE|nr:hypothetical protein [Aeromicrobium sp. Root495]KQY58354.1 hypothetical protein ASD11_01415 [Aeromicrobium sp. Root495]